MRDKKAFEVDALQDARITLKHALYMENLNMKIKKLGIPLTFIFNWTELLYDV